MLDIINSIRKKTGLSQPKNLEPFGVQLQNLTSPKKLIQMILQHGLVLIKNAPFKTQTQLGNFCENFGTPRHRVRYQDDSRVSTICNRPDQPADEQMAYFEIDWHQDLELCEHLPVEYVALFCKQTISDGGLTQFLDGAHLYESLTFHEKKFYDSIRVLESADALYRNLAEHSYYCNRTKDPFDQLRIR